MRLTVEPFKGVGVVNRSLEFVRFRVLEGRVSGFAAAASVVKGVMVVREEGESVVGMWINKPAVKPGEMKKIEGFKVKRQ